MLRVLGPSELEGYIFQTSGGPRCELLTGTISQIEMLTDAMAITIKGMYQNTIRSATILFKNRGADRKMLLTRVIAAGLTNGMFISVLVMQRNQKRIALDFKSNNALWRFKGYKGEINVLLGKAEDVRIQNDLVSFKFIEFNSSRQMYFRRTIDISGKILDQAKKDFGETSKKSCVCICGPERKTNGFSSYHCVWYELIDTTHFLKN